MNASEQIAAHIEKFDDWRGKMLTRLRKLIGDAAPQLSEEWKWNTPVWSYKGNVLAIGAFHDHVKINFFKGASLDDPNGLFNAGLEAKASRAIDIDEGDRIDEAGLRNLVRAAVALNGGGRGGSGGAKQKTAPAAKPTRATKTAKPTDSKTAKTGRRRTK